ncbi:MAG: NAD-dependent epimerase/dehydratase family protein, partial [Gammaproteobacteria bacterium]|nr:NAD-dependent epimerase/dehydratase family protein [Gammaproteobacteria bacterium]
DNPNDYYDVNLKQDRNKLLCDFDQYQFQKLDIADREAMTQLFSDIDCDRVVHLAAQAGVRDSINHPHQYTRSNIEGFLNILEGCRHQSIEHLVYASSSSVYGANKAMPFSEHRSVDHPLALYGATKKANELMAHAYANLYQLPTTGLRFFTVYGPWGRPDMALFLFTRNILADKPIDVYNHGKHQRDFTYVDDVVDGVIKTLDQVATADEDWSGDAPDPATSFCPYRVYNIGSNQPIMLNRYIELIEQYTGKTAQKNLLPMQPGDVESTWADISTLAENTSYQAQTSIEQGVENFVNWYLDYYQARSMTDQTPRVSNA